MKIEKYVKLSKNKYRIIFENGEVFDTYDNVIAYPQNYIRKY